MPRPRLSLAVSVALACLAAATASGAAEDDPEPEAPPSLEHTADIIPETVSTGFYARLDAGGWIGRTPTVGPGRFADAAAAAGGSFGAGAGLKATEWLRGDLSVDYAPAGRVSAACRGCTGGRRVGAELETLALLAGLYVDLPSLGAVTPYVGAAAGGAAVWADDVRFARPARRPGSATDVVAAWAVAAGASLPIGVSTSLDLGYRYLGFGDVDLGGRRKVTLADLGRHEIRLGVRIGAW